MRPRPSTVVTGFIGTMSLSDSRQGRQLFQRRQSRPASQSGPPTLPSKPSPRAVPTTPASRRASVSVPSRPPQRPSPSFGRIGTRIYPFEACSGFTHVTARGSARPPKVDFTQGFTSVPGSLPGCTKNSPGETLTHVPTGPPRGAPKELVTGRPAATRFLARNGKAVRARNDGAFAGPSVGRPPRAQGLVWLGAIFRARIGPSLPSAFRRRPPAPA